MSANACMCRGLTALGKVHCAACGRLLPRSAPIVRSRNERQRFLRAEDRADLPVLKRKHEYACCAATRDAYGRLCIGWCGPECERRPA